MPAPHPQALLIRNTAAGIDIRCRHDRIVSTAPGLCPTADETEIDAAGGAVIPGLHDHHLHLLAWARARESITCGPPRVNDRQRLTSHLQMAPGDGWIRGVGYHESVAGDLDRWRLDALEPHRPVRIQHRSGKMWYLNSAALMTTGIAADTDLPVGVERDAAGVPNGRLFRLDQWLRQRLPNQALPDIASASQRLAAWGITAFTDPGATNNAATMAHFAAAGASGALLQPVRLMGDATLPHAHAHPQRLRRGELKILLDDAALPEIDELIQRIKASHRQGRGVAIHCITRVELLFALAALGKAGATGRDRIEHAGITPAETIAELLHQGVTVVTQPNFIAERGSTYLRAVDPREINDLYRCASLLDHGVPVAFGSDAPYGDPNPWALMAAATNRLTACGQAVAPAERVSPATALRLYSGTLDCPGRTFRRIAPGMPADLCVLDRSWGAAAEALAEVQVLITIAGGRIIHRQPG